MRSVIYAIRMARTGDAELMGIIHVRAWQAAYRGVMPGEYLDGLSPEDRAAMWRLALDDPRPGQEVRVVSVDGTVAGFAASGPEGGTPEQREVGELYAINLDPGQWGKGLGRALLREVTRGFADSAYRSAVLWVARENDRARRLYESEGWTDTGIWRDAQILGAVVNEVRYGRTLDG